MPDLASAASLYETALKAARGHWPEVAFLLDRDITAELEGAGLRVLLVTGEIMQAAGALPGRFCRCNARQCS